MSLESNDARTHAHTHTCTHTCTHAHTRTHTCTHTHQIGSPTALSDPTVYKTMFEAAYHSPPHGLYVPAGAFWGGQDVQKMADRGTLKVSNAKH